MVGWLLGGGRGLPYINGVELFHAHSDGRWLASKSQWFPFISVPCGIPVSFYWYQGTGRGWVCLLTSTRALVGVWFGEGAITGQFLAKLPPVCTEMTKVLFFFSRGTYQPIWLNDWSVVWLVGC